MFGAWKPKPSGMRRWDGSHCLFRRIGASKTRCHDKTSKIPCFDTTIVEIGICSVRGNPSQVGCGGGQPRIACFAELGPRNHDVTTKPRRFPVLTRPSSRLEYVRCVETQAEWRREIAESRAQFGEILTAIEPTAASPSAWVATYQTHSNLDDERVKAGNLRGGVVKSPSRGPYMAKYAMRGSPPPHPTQLSCPSIKQT